jgi:hypothetical protein
MRRPSDAAPSDEGDQGGTEMDRTDEHTLAVQGAAGLPDPGPAGNRSTLLTAAAVCVMAAALAIVGWAHSTMRDAADGGRYSVVETPPGPPRATATSPQPLVPLLPPGPTSRGEARTGSARPRSATPTPRAATSKPAAPAVTGPAGMISGYAGKCLHVPGNNPLDGMPIEMTACDGSAGERWTMASDGTIRALGKCLDVMGDPAADGARIQLFACRGTAGQQWRFTAGGDLINPGAGKCLDVRDFNLGDGAALQLWTCVGGVNQKWSVPA